MKKYTAVQTPSSGKMSHYIYLPIGSLVEVNPKMEALQMQMDTVCASYKLPVTVVDPKQQHITLALLKLKDDETGKKCLELFQTAWKVKTEELQKDPEDNLLFRDDCTCLRLQGLHVFPSYKFIKSITASLENLYTSQSPYSTYDRDEYVSEATIVYAALDKKSLKAIRWMQDTLASVLSRSGCTDFWMQPVPHVACVHLKNNTIKTFNAEPILKEMKDRYVVAKYGLGCGPEPANDTQGFKVPLIVLKKIGCRTSPPLKSVTFAAESFGTLRNY